MEDLEKRVSGFTGIWLPMTHLGTDQPGKETRELSSHVSFIGCPGWRCAGPLHRWRLFDRWVYLILIGQSIFVCALILNCTAAVTFHVQ